MKRNYFLFLIKYCLEKRKILRRTRSNNAAKEYGMSIILISTTSTFILLHLPRWDGLLFSTYTYIDKSKLQIQSLKSVQNQYTNNMLNMGSKANLWQRLGYTKILNLNLFPARTRLKKSLTIWEHCCASKELGFRK